MSRPLRVAVLLVAAAGTLALGGCRGAAAASPAATAPVSSAGLDAPGAESDPLGSVESSISAIEKQVDQDGTG